MHLAGQAAFYNTHQDIAGEISPQHIHKHLTLFPTTNFTNKVFPLRVTTLRVHKVTTLRVYSHPYTFLDST